MKTKSIPIKEIKPNPNNPRLIKKDRFNRLKKSIKRTPSFMELRPVILDKNNVIQGGNMRLAACKDLKWKLIPVDVYTEERYQQDLEARREEAKENQVEYVDESYEDLCREFVIKDNHHEGQWDYDVLANEWPAETLFDMGIEIPGVENIKSDQDFEDRFNRMGDETALYPIAPRFDEDHELIVIVCETEIDLNWIRERLGMQKMKSYKRAEIAKSNVIHVNDLKNVL